MLHHVPRLRSLARGTVTSGNTCLSTRTWKRVNPQRKYAKVALFGDTHFQDRGLSRIVKSSNWIADEVVNRKCDAVVCLGDVLNTRELVSVRALSEALSFFDGLASRLNGVPLHIILGNHDINLKHSRKFSSLDALSLQAMNQSGITLHRDLNAIPNFLPGLDAIFLPYHENQAEITDFLALQAKNKAKSRETLVFGHLAVSGAQQNHSPYRYHGPLRPSAFAPFKRTFSGHFHHHHELSKNRIVYVGSPMQFNFGDSGDTRGIVIYDTDTDTYELIHNPFGEQYIKENEENLHSQITDLFALPEFAQLKKKTATKSGFQFTSEDIPPNRFKDKFIQIQMQSSDLTNETFDRLRESLLLLGASGISKSSQDIKSLIKEQGSKIETTETSQFKHFSASSEEDIGAIILNFAQSVRRAHMAALEAKNSAANSKSTLVASDSTKPSKKSNAKVETESEVQEMEEEDDDLNFPDVPSRKRKRRRMRQTVVQKESLHFLEDDAQFDKLVALGLELAIKSSPKLPVASSSHTTFKGRLHSLYMKNFMGIQGELTIPFYSMNSGIWLIEGPNGAGKSTVFEALVWAQFGEFLRSGMQKDYAINDNAARCTVRLIYENGLVIERTRRRARNEALRTYQLKKTDESPDAQFDMYRAGDLNEMEAAEEVILEDNVVDGSMETDRVEMDQNDEISKGSVKSKKTKHKKAEQRGKVKTTGSHKMAYEPESELGDIRNTQQLLSERLGVDFETFTKSVVLGQNILSNFVSGNKDMRRAIIEEMLGLEKFNEWLESARKERTKLDEELKLLLQKRKMLQSELDGINSSGDNKAILVEEKTKQLESLKAKKGEIEISSNSRILRLESELSAKLAEIASEEMSSLVKEIKALKEGESIGFNSSMYSRLVSFYASCNELIQHLQRANIAPEAHGDSKEGQTDGLGDLVKCGTCGQVVTEEHISKMAKQAVELATQGLKLLEGHTELSPRSSPKPVSAHDAYDYLVSVATEIQSYKKKLELKSAQLENLRNLELLISRLETGLAQARVQGSEEKASISEACITCEVELEQLKATRDENRSEMISLQGSILQSDREIEAKKVELSMTKFWEMAFDKQSKGTVGTVRAFVFEDVVNELNAICNTYMQQLQGKHQHHLRVSLSADLEIEQVYGKRSGGERRRTDLAILFAMFELVRGQSRYVPDFLMLDEVFDALDQEGRDLVGQVLANLSKRLEKILVITHTDVASGLSVAGTLDVDMPYDPLGKPSGTEIEINHR